MTVTRTQVLTIGPILLVAICFGVSAPLGRTANQQSEPIKPSAEETGLSASGSMPLSCETIATCLRAKLLNGYSVIVSPPYVIAGDLPENDLRQIERQTITPATRSLEIAYFGSTPMHPITVVICSSLERFREANLRLDDQDRPQYSGLYVRKSRRIIVNFDAGQGALIHELTHALSHADFPAMPEWFDEGLASLYEDSEFSADQIRLVGHANWRHEIAREALQQGELRLLEDVAARRFGSRDRAQIDYACVRSLCLYLQERGLLEAFYRTCRSNIKDDPTGLRSLCLVAGMPNPGTLDDAFRTWLIETHPAP